MSNTLNQKLFELHLHQSETGNRCSLTPEEIAAHEAAGRIVDLDTGEVLPDITPDTRVDLTINAGHIPTTPQDIDALAIELRATLKRLQRRSADDNAFMRGFKSGAESAYSDILRLLGQDVDGEGQGNG